MLAVTKFLIVNIFNIYLDPNLVQSLIALNLRSSPEPIMSTTTTTTTTTAKTMLSAAASLAASAVLIRTITTDLVPESLQSYISSSLSALVARLSSNLTVVIDESDGIASNLMYRAAETYLGTKISPSTRRLRVGKSDDSDALEVTMARGEEIVDLFDGVQFRWRLVSRDTHRPVNPRRRHYIDAVPIETRSFELTFNKKHKDRALQAYLPYLLERSKAIRDEAKALKLYTNDEGGAWTAVNLHHPATFETLAMEAEVKRGVMEDLQRFVRRKEYYRRIGKAWKRGYLLYGPPGTGKSSMIAAMANYLKFDVYDLELTEVRSNAGLRELLLGTTNRSILVVEDIDCSTMDLQQRETATEEKPDSDEGSKVTLSGLLNFVDGLWSSCGDERIIVFTTNYKDRLDPALLRPGRMDMHIHMTYCSPYGFKVLASNYHLVDDHPLFPEIEGLIGEMEITPAEVAEELMRSDDVDIALRGLMEFLHVKKEASKAKNREVSVEG